MAQPILEEGGNTLNVPPSLLGLWPDVPATERGYKKTVKIGSKNLKRCLLGFVLVKIRQSFEETPATAARTVRARMANKCLIPGCVQRRHTAAWRPARMNLVARQQFTDLGVGGCNGGPSAAAHTPDGPSSSRQDYICPTSNY